MVKRVDLVDYLNDRLEVEKTPDRSNNGLQVEGPEEISRIALATDAAMAVYQKAAQNKCQMLIAHHGIIWGGLDSITGRDYEHIKFLIENKINLYAAHLPLDCHPELGNSAELAKIAGLRDLELFGHYNGINLGFEGTLPRPMNIDELAAVWQKELGGEPVKMAFGPKEIRVVGVTSGSGSVAMAEAIEKGIDCLVTGEGSHPDYHQALEGKINMIYLGHYRSETTGVKALGLELEEKFGLQTVFIDEPTIF